MKQINLPFAASASTTRNLIFGIITDFSMWTNEDSNNVNVYIEIKDLTDEIIKYNFTVERRVAEYYQEYYETKQTVSILTVQMNYLIFTPDINIV